jgi:hypothetical protein
MPAIGYAAGIMRRQGRTRTGEKRRSEIASMGGKTRARELTADQRSSIASEAASARWNLPKAMHSGEFVINGKRIACAVLETGKRLLTQDAFRTAIGDPGHVTVIDGMPPFLVAENLKPFISDQLRESTTAIFFRDEIGARRAGYEASLLPMVCEVYRKLNDQFHAGGKPIPSKQAHIIATCDLLERGLARVGGIVALIDKVTGYQATQVKEKLAGILETSVAAELRPWIRRFPDEFFLQLFHLQGEEFKPGSNPNPAAVADFINEYIYKQLPPDVVSGLRGWARKTEKRYRRESGLQSLIAKTGNPHLDQQINIVTTLLKIARSRAEFQDLFNRAFAPKEPLVVVVDA